MQNVEILVGGLSLQRKCKFILKINGVEHKCISATHVSMILNEHDINFSKADVYNWLDPKRGKKNLSKRFPANVEIEKCRSSDE